MLWLIFLSEATHFYHGINYSKQSYVHTELVYLNGK